MAPQENQGPLRRGEQARRQAWQAPRSSRFTPSASAAQRLASGFVELDRVLGGGLWPGFRWCWWVAPGPSGKSTLACLAERPR